MQQITACISNDCPIRLDCYRYKAESAQSRTEFKFNRCGNGVICDFYMPLYTEKTDNILEKKK